jgi:hypothetical protein
MARQNVGERPRDRDEANHQPAPVGLPSVLVLIVYAVIAGAAVSATAYLCAWLQLRDATQFRAPIAYETHAIRRLKRLVDQYLLQHGELPSELGPAVPEDDELRVVAADRVADYSGRIYLYRRTEAGYEIASLGADGQPGGIGLDADLYDDGRYSASPRMTLRQFSTAPATASVRSCSAIAGAAATLMCLWFNFVDLRRE